MINSFDYNKRVKTLEKNLDFCIDVMFYAKRDRKKEKFLRAKKLKYHYISELEKMGEY